MDDGHADQADNAHTDPLRRHVEQVGTNRHADDEYDVSNDVDSKRHRGHPRQARSQHRTRARSVTSVRQDTEPRERDAKQRGTLAKPVRDR